MVAAFGLTGPWSREQSWTTGGRGGGRENLHDSERERERDERTVAGRHEGKQEYLQALDRGAMAAQRPSDYRYYTGVKQRTAPP